MISAGIKFQMPHASSSLVFFIKPKAKYFNITTCLYSTRAALLPVKLA
jgi:hypothetical protein